MTINETITSNFMLATYSKGMISATRPDKAAGEELAQAHGVTEANAVRAYKTIFSGEIAKVYRACSNAERRCYRLFSNPPTMPFTASEKHNRGARSVPVAYAMQLSTDVELAKAEFYQKVEELAQAVDDPQNRARAVSGLGSLGDDSLLPTGNDVREKCYIEFDLQPMPATVTLDSLPLPAEFAEKLAEKIAADNQTAMNKGLDDLKDHVDKEVKRVADRARVIYDYLRGDRQGKAPAIHETLKTNIESLTGMLSTAAASVGRMDMVSYASDVKDALTRYEVRELRVSQSVAFDLYTQATRIAAGGAVMPGLAPKVEELASRAADGAVMPSPMPADEKFEQPEGWPIAVVNKVTNGVRHIMEPGEHEVVEADPFVKPRTTEEVMKTVPTLNEEEEEKAQTQYDKIDWDEYSF